jgi:hypothetical protein
MRAHSTARHRPKAAEIARAVKVPPMQKHDGAPVWGAGGGEILRRR